MKKKAAFAAVLVLGLLVSAVAVLFPKGETPGLFAGFSTLGAPGREGTVLTAERPEATATDSVFAETGAASEAISESASAGEPSESFPAEKTVADTIEKPTEPAVAPETEPVSAEEPTGIPAKAPEKTPAKTPTVIVPNFEYHGALDMNGKNEYSFTLSSRGAVRYTFSVPENPMVPGDWEVSLYARYYLDGVSGETGLRLLNIQRASNVAGETVSPFIGLNPGEYLLTVTPGETVSTAGYFMRLDFTPGTAYEIECNDTPSRYTSIYTDVAIQGSASDFGADKTDEDWYLLRLPVPAAIDLRFSHETRDLTTVPFVVSLMDASRNVLFTGRSAFTETMLSTGLVGLAAGDYFIRVEGRVKSDLSYTLLLSRALTGVYEQEPNDTIRTATFLAPETPYYGAVLDKNGVDFDWFSVKTEKSGFLTLTLQNPGVDETDDRDVRRLTLTDEKGRRIWSGLLANWDDSLVTPPIGVPAGTLYVSVDDDSLYHVGGAYILSYTLTPAADCEWEYNGEKALANDLNFDVPVRGTVTDDRVSPDEDWFRFTVTETSDVKISISHTPGDGRFTRYSLTVTDSHDNFVAALDCPDENGSVDVAKTLTPGVYFIRFVSGDFGGDAGYTLTVTKTTP